MEPDNLEQARYRSARSTAWVVFVLLILCGGLAMWNGYQLKLVRSEASALADKLADERWKLELSEQNLRTMLSELIEDRDRLWKAEQRASVAEDQVRGLQHSRSILFGTGSDVVIKGR